MDLAALHEALDALAQAVLAVENRSAFSADTHLFEAHLAAAVAFRPGSEQARALIAVIAAVDDAAQARGLAAA